MRRNTDRRPLRRLALGLALAALGAAAPFVATASSADPERDARLLHLLSRATFGPTPALLEEVRRVGAEAWLRDQLRPERIADPDLETRLSIYPALPMSFAELIANYPRRRAGEPQEGIGPPGRIVVEMQAALLTRAVHARAQLREVLTDFWLNHFNVFAAEGPLPYMVLPYVRDAIRPHVLGRFEDLLRATAESPAMLYYLDNYLSSRPRRRGGGINENYARELMELHTLGVDGGQTQRDVIEVARAFTGWTFTRPETHDVLGFLFDPFRHEAGEKVVLGHVIPSGGKDEGDRILTLLAHHPSTAEFIATKLVRRFVSDDPPAALVARARDAFLASDGDLAWVTAVILTAEEFYDPRYRLAKVKSPLEIVASSLRAAGAEVDLGVAAARLVEDLGQGIALARPPTGWPEEAAEFLSAGGMVRRFELAYRVATGDIPGIRIDRELWERVVALWGVEGIARLLLLRPPETATSDALERARAEGARGPLLAALALASPEFQRQ